MEDIQEFSMNNEWKNFADTKPVYFDFMEDMIYFFMFFPALVFADSFSGSDPLIFLKILVVPCSMLLMTVNRRLTRKFHWFALIEILIIFGVFLIPTGQINRITFTASATGAAFVSFHKVQNILRMKQYRNDPDVAVNFSKFLGYLTLAGGLAAIYFTYMLALSQKKTQTVLCCFVSFVLMLTLYEVYIHIAGTYCLLEWKKSKTGSLIKIKDFNLLFAVWAVILFSLTGLISYVLVYSTGIDRVDSTILSIFRQNNIGVPSSSGGNQIDFTKTLNRMALNNKPGYAAMIFSKVLNLLLIFLAAVIGIALLLLITRALYSILKKFRINLNEESSTVFSFEEASAEIRQKIKTGIGKTFRLNGNSNRLSIRRLYYRTIKRHQKSGLEVYPSDTPKEIMLKIKQQSGLDLDLATNLYEKARYGESDSTKQEMEQMKNLLKSRS
ncbi:MAG TPA: DUF4129 domain-containing protein [Clostridia bacterium]|nr:DUF4129 domain-containing protein [Clostridia bacterium]